ncbi:MAG: type I glyceraldehyde-3-phosphate dehydrogenase [Patescibacteria group bacterium]|nr:type I glyceraldehyde-3-phosphate dehydrogenase [Patescibacteria group bacterium]MDE2438543.1 type I glyceraldehyde-3-phosphate dehydrogenase [Patescibacteria group bacterium]
MKIAINGFGRIGRLLFRELSDKAEIVAINDLGDIENLAYLLKYDTVYGRYEKNVDVRDGNLMIEDTSIKVFQVKDPHELPWGELGVDIAVEATGFFESFEKAKAHIDAGAKRVVITAPAKDADGVEGGKTVLMGVNDEALKTCLISSNGSCTTNATSPVMEVLEESLGIEKAMLSTIHGYTATQNLVDGPTRGKDFRRGRAAGQNIVPSSTGAAIAVARAIPRLEEKFDGIAFRVPVITGSVADITCLTKRNTTVEEVNALFRDAAEQSRWKGIFKVSDDQLVSSDIQKDPYGAIVDTQFTRVVDGNLVKVVSWYDNEWGYVATLVQHILKAGETF